MPDLPDLPDLPDRSERRDLPDLPGGRHLPDRSERRAGTLPFDHTDPLLAAAAWSALVEPADEAAGVMVATLGAVGALDRLLHWDRTGVVRMSTRGAELQGRALLDRCRPRLAGLDPRRDLDRLAALGGRPVLPGDPDWPAGLDDLGTRRPFLLWLRGRLPGGVADASAEGTPGPGEGASAGAPRPLGAGPLSAFPDRPAPGAGLRAVAIVGSRASTSYGAHVAAEFAVDLVRAGYSVVSGGAFGIDIAAHRACLAAGGTTVAVLAGGVDRLYPRAHEDHLERIAATGALVAEVPPGAEPRRHRFLTRNRIIAALGSATVVVEAGLRSGALRTAREAIGLGRPLGAVPGPVMSPTSAGCHDLLREAMAVCVTTGLQVRELIEPIGAARGGDTGSGGASEYGPAGPVPAGSPPGDRAGGARDRAKATRTGSSSPPSARTFGAAGMHDGSGPPPPPPRGAIVQPGLLDGLDPTSSRVLDALPLRAARDADQVAAAAGLAPGEVRSALGLLELGGRVQRADGRWRRVSSE